MHDVAYDAGVRRALTKLGVRSDAGIKALLQKLRRRTKPGQVSHQMRNDRLPGSGAGWDPGGHDI